MKIFLLRILHGVFATYFLICLLYAYYAAFTATFDLFLLIAGISLAIEGFLVFVINQGDCPLIHIQRVIGDNKPFFELFFPPVVAKKALPVFAGFTWFAMALLIIRAYINII
jgi:hypothetical protein